METLAHRIFRTAQKNKCDELDAIYKKRFVQWILAPDHVQDYCQGARVWIPHPEKVWVGAKVTEYANKKLSVITDDQEAKVLSVVTDDDLPPLRNPDILIGQNDLTSLSYLHEPAVLYNLQVRFCQSKNIYTYCGIVLVAINPYCEVSIYDPGTIWMYRGQNMGDLDPHIFAVAEEAYTKIEREQMNQSIIVSGESGAGKTVSAKYAMRYFATVGGSSTETQVEKKVLASSPIMEAIGNAKTIRNDNSSRFGKYIELHFSKSYTIIGASMSTYLLEKSRVVYQASGERNYHIFYQMCAARKSLKHLFIEDATEYKYLCDPDSTIPGVSDEKQFEETKTALSTLGFEDKIVDDIFTILASVLHLGNVAISEHGGGDNEAASIPSNDPYLNCFCQLLQLDLSDLRRWLCNRKIVSMRETINKQLSSSEARQARDALAKHIYACLFTWIVGQINRELITSSEAKHRFIGVLDIYGFETFEVNSFEQFCINYANEKLQQQFNMHVFKLEQEEYLKEGIEWKLIDFYDNQPCIDLIETKLGILDLLDEECRMPKGSDNSWAEKLYSKCTKWSNFSKPRFGNNSFVLKHFADKVEYDVYGFLDKNRDTVIEEQVTVLKTSQNKLIRKLFSEECDDEGKLAVPKPKVRISLQQKAPPSPSPANSVKNKKTVGSQFRDSLNALMKTLNSTTPHYIRCIKPNDDKQAFSYNPSRAVQQLRACGVLETVRISAAGFPSRWQYSDFLKRYRALASSKEINRQNLTETCQTILTRIIKDPDKYKFGKTKLFFRAGQVAYLERLRSEKLLYCCIKIQTVVRGYLVRKRYTRTLKATNTLQRYLRGFLARRRVEGMRRNKAAVVIQKWVRRWVKQKQYKRARRTILGIQAFGRGYLARKKYQEMRRNRAAIKIQTCARGWLCRVRYSRERHHVIICQAAVRRFLARRRFRTMKREARSAEHLKKLNKGLENKIISLQQKNSELMKEMSLHKNLVADLEEAKARISSLKPLEATLKTLKQQNQEKENMIIQLMAEVKEYKEMVALKEENDILLRKREEEVQRENDRFRAELAKLECEIADMKSQKEEELQQQLQAEMKQLIDERTSERAAYQKLIAEKDALESKLEVLERTTGKHKRSSSDASSISMQDEDNGYASVRSANSYRDETPTPEQQVDINLVLKLQHKLKALERENHLLHSKFEKEDRIFNHKGPDNNIKVEELEVENSRLKNDLNLIREAVAYDTRSGGNTALVELKNQAEFWEREAMRAREEAATLREALGHRTSSASSLARSSYPNSDLDTTFINEDGELILAFEAQKKTLRQLENERQSDLMRWGIEREELVGELERVRADNERLRNIVSGTLEHSAAPIKAEAFLRSEVTRLTSENLDLQEKFDSKTAKLRKVLEQNKELIRRLKDAGVSIETLDEAPANHKQLTTQTSLPVIKKKEREEFEGMFEVSHEDIEVFIRHLIELSPKVAITLLPGLPAYILFMVVRYFDYKNDDSSLQLTVMAYTKKVTRMLKRKANDVDMGVLWLANTLRLLHNLKQYSGDKHFAKENTQRQNEQCLRNFDLSELRQVLSDKAIQICQGVLKRMCDLLQPLAVSAILEHEAVMGISRARSSSVASQQPAKKEAMDQLLNHLSNFNRTLSLHGVDPQLVSLFFMQLFYYLCANALNNLMLRKDYCHWSRGMHMRYNLSYLEQWAREQKVQDPRVVDMLQPIIQAAQLLQARKYVCDVDNLIEMCSKLTPNQILKLLHLYTTHDSYDDKVSEEFMQTMQKRLKELRPNNADNTLMMDVHKSLPLEFPFNPSSIRLEDVEIPEVLNIPMLKKL